MRKKSFLEKLAGSVMDAIADNKDPLPEIYTCKITTAYHQNSIAKLLVPSKAYKVPPSKVMDKLREQVVFKYETGVFQVDLVPEANDVFPDSVTIKHHGMPVGYVRPDDQAMVKRYVKAGCTASVKYTGGPFRIVSRDDSVMKSDNNFSGELTILLAK